MALTSKRPTQINPDNQTKLEDVTGEQVLQKIIGLPNIYTLKFPLI